ncbi:MAG: D-alanyl-D-alanine carboxypeptidase/D-alanyl-D-alanine-endopeptidase [Deltaproteobacteria bacterium]|nr:D-alanyl-D-alanine carboxypeptidase/D-alanyl-D-alanine-endopeptidase [Deltaproteobacteria bacterium]
MASTRSRWFALPLLTLSLLFSTGVSRAEDAPAGRVPAPSSPMVELLQPITRDSLFREADVAWQVVSVRTGEEVFSYQGDKALHPASTMKILTAATALHDLGPAFRFKTEVLTDGKIAPNGDLNGNLYVRGGGDPTFVVEQLWKVLWDLKLEGVTRVRGDVIFDEGYLDTSYALPGWDKAEDLERGPSYFPSLSALSINYNTVALVVGPGAEVGGAARVGLETPVSDYVEVESLVKTGAPGSSRWLKIDREEVGKTLKFTLTGSIPSESGVRKYYRTVLDPTAHFMAAWEEMSKQVGIAVDGHYVRGTAPAGGDLVVEHRSPPLSAILMDMNKYSNNFMAEQVLRTLGAEEGGQPGTTDKGLTAIRAYLSGLGIDESEYTLVNGSGLSRDIDLRPSHLTAVMVDMAQDQQVGREFGASLAIAGWDGTLWRRLSEEPGMLRGKTGTLDGVHCLTGYVEGGDGETYAFAFLVNGFSGSSAKVKRVHDQFARELLRMSGPAQDATASGND